MFGFFTFLHFVGFIAFFIFLINFLKNKKRGLATYKAKKLMLVAIAVWCISFVMMLFTVDNTQTKEESSLQETSKKELSTEESSLQETSKIESSIEESSNNDYESLKNELNEKYELIGPYEFVRGDNTGKWRIVKTASGIAPSTYAVDYAKVYMQDTDIYDIHFIVDFTLSTTTKIQNSSFGILSVTTTEYVSGEEHDASIIGGGLLLSKESYDMETGEKIVVQSNPDAGTADNDTLIMAVKDAIGNQVGTDDKITDVSFDGKDIYISVTVAQPNSEYITKKDIAESRISSITDAILDLNDRYFNTWETITLDFGEEGKATFKKEDVKDEGLGKFFEVPIGILQ